MSAKPRYPGAQENAHVLLVEGNTDEHVVGHIWGSKHDSDPPFLITGGGGKSRVMEEIAVRLKEPGLRTLGIIVDADQDVDTCWRDIKETMVGSGIRLPDAPDSEGTIVCLGRDAKTTRSLSKVGVWIAPDNESAGELEDFIAAMMPSDDVVWPLAQSYISGVVEAIGAVSADRSFSPRNKTRLFQPHRRTRATVWAWMATRRQTTRIGIAIRKGDLDTNVALCQRFVMWLERLFEEVASETIA